MTTIEGDEAHAALRVRIADLERQLAEVMIGLVALSPTLANDPRPVDVLGALRVVTAEYAALIQDHAELEGELAKTQTELSELKVGAHADETGHLHRCARVNGVWNCAKGCAVAERDALKARLAAALNLLREAETQWSSDYLWKKWGMSEAIAALDVGKEMKG